MYSYETPIKILYDLSQNVAEIKAFRITVPFSPDVYYENFQTYQKGEEIVQGTATRPQS